jgi:Anti-sigma-K factor rskA
VSREPDFLDVVGKDVPAEERDRLRRVHDLLVAAGPPPELPPALATAPESGATVRFLPRRHRGALLLLAAALAAAAFGGGYLVGGRTNEKSTAEPVRVVPMHGTELAPHALASLRLAAKDDSGNWPMEVVVRGLPKLPSDAYYELYLTRKGRPVAPCGSFLVHGGTTRVRLNAPYELKRFDGWVVTRQLRGQRDTGTLLLTT